MNKRRLELQSLLELTLGSRNVYFQSPSNVKMKYPCIVYSRSNITDQYANNAAYKRKTAYTITLITTDPDSDLVSKIKDLPLCRHDRSYVADGLNHDVFTLFY